MTPKVIVDVADEPLTIAECRLHLKLDPDVDSNDVESHPDDSLVLALLSAAREHCEKFTGLSLAPKTYEVALDEFPEDEIELPMGPVISVTSITVDGEAMDAADYELDDYTHPARIMPTTSWPSVTASTNLIKIRYQAGYGEGTDQTLIPYVLRAAILLVLGHLYENREDFQDIPLGAKALMRPYRVKLGLA